MHIFFLEATPSRKYQNPLSKKREKEDMKQAKKKKNSWELMKYKLSSTDYYTSKSKQLDSPILDNAQLHIQLLSSIMERQTSKSLP